MLLRFLLSLLAVKTVKPAAIVNKDLLLATEKGLTAHNTYRAKHGVDPLKLDDEVTQFAQKYADFLATSDYFDHNQNNPNYGENLYRKCSRPTTPGVKNAIVDATFGWYNEISKYNFDKPSYIEAAGHFTQLVWKDTTKVGFGVSIGTTKRNGKIFNCVNVVANYYPPGNYIHEFEQNVFKPK